MLDLLLEHFGDGVRWTRGRYYDGRGRHCLIGAIHYLHLRLKHRIPSEPALHFLREAMPRRTFGLVYFNDYRCRGFDELRAVILKARALALGEAEWGRTAAAVERWLSRALEEERNKRLADGNVRSRSPLRPMAPEEVSLAHVEEPWCRQVA
jgi:hypothetical protein